MTPPDVACAAEIPPHNAAPHGIHLPSAALRPKTLCCRQNVVCCVRRTAADGSASRSGAWGRREGPCGRHTFGAVAGPVRSVPGPNAPDATPRPVCLWNTVDGTIGL